MDSDSEIFEVFRRIRKLETLKELLTSEVQGKHKAEFERYFRNVDDLTSDFERRFWALFDEILILCQVSIL